MRAQVSGTNRASKRSWRLASLLTAIALIAVSLGIPASAQAGRLTRARAVQSQQVIENDVFLSGEQPRLDGVVNGDAFIVGTEVSVNGEVNGSLFILANNADIQGDVAGNLFIAAVGTRQRAGSSIGRSLYSLGVSLILEREAQIGRDLRMAAISANLQGEIGRDTHAVIGLLELWRLLNQGLQRSITGLPASNWGSFASAVSMGERPRLVAAVVGLPVLGSGIYGATMRGEIQRELLLEPQPAGFDSAALGQWLLTRFLSLVAFFLVGALALWLFPGLLDRWVGLIEARPLASAGYGALVLINGFLLPVLLVALLAGLTFGLVYLALPWIAWMIFGAALGTLTAAFSLFLLAVTYLSKAIFALLVGSLILSQLGRGAVASNRWLALLLGLVLYVLLASIPYLGFFVGLAVTLLGMGALWLGRRAPAPVPLAVAA